MSRVQISKIEQPLSWRLLTSEIDEMEELIFTVTGVVSALDLPPVLNRHA
jgi:hypothetical protein